LLRLEHLEERCTPTVTFTVNTLDDTPVAIIGAGTARDRNGNVSLRSAIQEARVTTDDVVIQLVGLTGTITLNSALPALSNSSGIYINNDTGSSGVTIKRGSNAHEFDIFQVTSGTTAIIGGLTISNGLVPFGPGGAILNYGNLTVSGCNITANGAASGGGIANIVDTESEVDPQLTVIGTTLTNNLAISGNGGAIYNEGVVNINSNCVISGNAAVADGGGIWNNGGLTITNSTINNNTSTQGNGGGIWNSGSMDMEDSTVSSNNCSTAGANGGGLYLLGSGTLTNCTFQSNTATNGSAIWVVNTAVYTFTGLTIAPDNSIQNGGP
jgi:hypothetical protein